MFRTISTPDVVELFKHTYQNTRYLHTERHWFCFDPVDKVYGWTEPNSFYEQESIYIKELNQATLTQLVLLHSIGFTPKEIAGILNE